MLPDLSGAIFHRIDNGVALSLFTSKENLVLFAQRAGLGPDKCAIGEMLRPSELKALLSRPSSRSEISDNFMVFIDPVAPDTGEFVAFTRDQLLEACDGG